MVVRGWLGVKLRNCSSPISSSSPCSLVLLPLHSLLLFVCSWVEHGNEWHEEESHRWMAVMIY
jgi:hypothetical protein